MCTVAIVALTLDEIKGLISFALSLGLQSLQAEGVAVVYGLASPAPVKQAETQDEDQNISGLPPELRHYSAQGKTAWGKTA